MNLCAGTLTSDPSSSTVGNGSPWWMGTQATAFCHSSRTQTQAFLGSKLPHCSPCCLHCHKPPSPRVSVPLSSVHGGTSPTGSGARLPQDDLTSPNHGYRDPISKFGPILRS